MTTKTVPERARNSAGSPRSPAVDEATMLVDEEQPRPHRRSKKAPAPRDAPKSAARRADALRRPFASSLDF